MIGVNRRRVMGGHDEIIMTSETNPQVLAVCYAQGWAKHADYMTKAEAEDVTNIGTTFKGTGIVSFNEFQYFINVTSLSNDAFMGCTSLTEFSLPKGITLIPYRCFFRDNKLTSINTNNVTSISPLAFYNCNLLTSVDIKNCEYVGAGAFSNCTSLNDVGSVSSIVSMGSGGEGNFQNTALQGELSFDSFTGTAIPNYIIKSCAKVTGISFPASSYTSVGEYALFQSGVISFVIREGCTTANNHSFSSRLMEYIDIPSTFTTWNGFALHGNEKQKAIVCRATTPPTIGNPGEGTSTLGRSFFSIPSTCKVYVPSASLDAYKVADGWRALKDRMLSIEGSWYETHREIDPNDE